MLDDYAKILKIQPQGQRAVEAAIRRRLDEWIDAVNSGTVDDVDELYRPDAMLLGTFDPKPRTTRAGRRGYFTRFKARKNLAAAIDECRIDILGSDAATASGFYTFRFEDGDGAPQTVKARFTFVYARQLESDWLILTHHSSVQPNP